MQRLMLYLRNRFHPLFHLRRFSAFQRATRLLDMPVAIRFREVSHPVYVSFSKNLSWVLSGGAAAEQGERANFVWLIKLAGFRRFLDVGANIGLYGFMFESAAGGATVTMLEPDRANAGLIRKTIAASKLDSTVVEAAASDESGTLPFYGDDLTGATGSLVRASDDAFIAIHHHRNPSEVSVRTITVDELYPDASPDFIKIDVEGAELKVLHGAERTLTRSHPPLMFECDRNQDAVRDLLQNHGYAFFDMETLEAVDAIPHNCLALHSVQHAGIIAAVSGRSGASVSGPAQAG